MRRLRLMRMPGVLLCAMLLAVGATARAQAPAPAEAPLVLHVGSPGNPASLDPHKITGVWENRIVGDMFLGLTTEGPDGSVRPGAAESWTVSPDGLVYTFRLREHRWSDGSPVTAGDFEYSLKRMLAPETACPYADFFFVIEGARAYTTGAAGAGAVQIETLDERTLKIVLEEPTAYFTGLLMHFAAMPVPQEAIEQHGRAWTAPENIVVNGPFIVAERVPNARVALRRNPAFYDAAAVEIDRVVYHVSEDRDAAVQRFRTGEFDVVRDFPSSRTDWLRENLGPGVVRAVPYEGLTFIAVNHRRPALGDGRVRAALAMALDREVIADKLLGSGEQPAYGLVPPETSNYGELVMPARYAWADWAAAERLAKARDLLAEAGYSQQRPLELELRYRISENDRRLAVAAQSMWRAIGIDVTLLSSETAAHYAALENGEFDLGIAAWLAVYSDPQTFTLLLQSKTSANNFGAYHNSRYDELTELASRAVDREQRAAYLREAESLALADNGLIPVYHHASRNLVSARVTGWRDNGLDVHRSRYLGLEGGH